MSEDFIELARVYLPKYLSPTKTEELYQALRQFPRLPSFYVAPRSDEEDLLQGDGWRGFVVRQFDGELNEGVSGIILSNSCDMDIRNSSQLATRQILFCPLISLSRYEEGLIAAKRTKDQVKTAIEAIRTQRITDIFHLPAGAYGPAESIAMLDDIHPHPLQHFLAGPRERLFRLHDAAFYLFVVKLSIHFCRLQEGVIRAH